MNEVVGNPDTQWLNRSETKDRRKRVRKRKEKVITSAGDATASALNRLVDKSAGPEACWP